MSLTGRATPCWRNHIISVWVSETKSRRRPLPSADFDRQQSWVLIALRNALWQLLHAHSLEEGVIDTVKRGGDTDTNAAICSALLGAVHGLEAIQPQWLEKVLNCRPQNHTGIVHPIPEILWSVDALELARLLTG